MNRFVLSSTNMNKECVLIMKKFNFEVGEYVTFFWNLSEDSMKLTAKKAKVTEIEDTGVWFEFDGEEGESFVTYPDMHLFIREGSVSPEGTHSLFVNQITEAHFGKNISPEEMIKLIESLTE
ncbi:hypothetical protein D3C74_91350 [compost metagenome]